MNNGRLYDPVAYDTARDIPSYWRDTCEPDITACPVLETETQADVVIIGAGYTGLNAAHQLASEHGRDCVVLEAGYPGWGASGRNGGFCSMGSTKRSKESLVSEFGLDELIRFEHNQMDAVKQVRSFLDDNNIDADVHSDGKLQVAHRPKDMKTFEKEAEGLQSRLGLKMTVYPKDALKELGAYSHVFHGALHSPIGLALNPMKYITGLAAVARAAGVRIHGGSEVIAIEQQAGGYHVRTAKGSVKAKQLLIASNGYSSEQVPMSLGGRLLPIMSNIIVTRPLTEDEKKTQGWWCDYMTIDSRKLVHYFRILPDGRFMFGMRGGTNASEYGLVANELQTRRHFERMFPKWMDVEHTHFWSGLVCMTYDLLPYIGPMPELPNAWASLGYHGNGVAMASWSGRQVADQMAGVKTPDDLPAALRGPLRSFPIPFMRLLYFKAACLGYTFMDEWL